ncbi:MAG: glycosyl hydrolase family 95 catalytic domain-containing protein [Trebonia sp.]
MRRPALAALAVLAAAEAASPAGPAPSGSTAAGATTAWRGGQFAVNTAAVVGSSDVVLKYPNTLARESMPVGNGALGAAVWSADGMTAQLNRPDAMPDRESPGQVVIPGLSALTGAPDYHGALDMYDGEFTESGGGMTATARVQAGQDEFVVDVTGADPDKTQTASVYLWAPRTQWNLRMQVQANLSAGVPELNAPYFRLYTENLPNIEAWTTANMDGSPGACVPETMRFNGAGVQYSTDAPPAYDCDDASPPFYNARTLTTGAEVSLWAWQEYLMTGDTAFLRTEFPLMAASARFLLSYATLGSDGYLHTYPANAHETQWDVHDPTTGIAAMAALFPAMAQASSILHEDSPLAAQLTKAAGEVPPLPRTDAATQTQLLTPAADASGDDVIAPSYDPAAPKENSENIGLEPVWARARLASTSPARSTRGVRRWSTGCRPPGPRSPTSPATATTRRSSARRRTRPIRRVIRPWRRVRRRTSRAVTRSTSAGSAR